MTLRKSADGLIWCSIMNEKKLQVDKRDKVCNNERDRPDPEKWEIKKEEKWKKGYGKNRLKRCSRTVFYFLALSRTFLVKG